MDLRTELIKAVRDGQQATNRAAYELDRVRKMYEMTDAGIATQRDKLFAAAREVADAAKARGLAAIDAKVDELDVHEQAEGARRAADTDYMQRLESKLRIAQGMGEIKQEDRDRLKTLFSEFAGDPLAVAVIKNTLGEEKSFYFLPEDNTGKRQDHIKTAVKKLFERAMDEAGCNPASFSANPAARVAEVDAFIEYCNRQDPDFSRPDREVWQELYNARKVAGTPDALKFDMFLTMGM